MFFGRVVAHAVGLDESAVEGDLDGAVHDRHLDAAAGEVLAGAMTTPGEGDVARAVDEAGDGRAGRASTRTSPARRRGSTPRAR